MDPRCLEIGRYYNEKDISRYFSLTLRLISRDYKKKLEAVEEILRDREAPEKILRCAYGLYEEISDVLKLKSKPLEFFRKISLKTKPESPVIIREKAVPRSTEEYPGERLGIKKVISNVGVKIEKWIENVVAGVEDAGRKLERVPRTAKLVIPIAAELAFFAFLFHKEGRKINSINQKIKQTQELCLYTKEKKEIKKLAKNLEGKIIYVQNLKELEILNKEIKPGKHSLSEFFHCDSSNPYFRAIDSCLATTIVIKKRKKPLSTPVENPIYSSGYGAVGRTIKLPTGGYILRNKPHKGQDYCSSKPHIYSAGNGIVLKAGYGHGYGNYIDIYHGKWKGRDLITRYAHCRKIFVSVGDSVIKGQLIAMMGQTGLASGPHLHYEVRIDGMPRNPLYYTERTEALEEAKNNNSLKRLQFLLEK